MANIFVSYAREDDKIMQPLADMLRDSGQEVFFDRSISAGETWSDAIGKSLANANAGIVLLSRNSNRNSFVGNEINAALQQGHPVIPVLLDDDATENSVWPLVSDRSAIKIDSPEQLKEVVAVVNRVLGETRPMPAYAIQATRLSRSTTLLVAILSALAGAFLMWWLRGIE